jgi:hypothetical protein
LSSYLQGVLPTFRSIITPRVWGTKVPGLENVHFEPWIVTSLFGVVALFTSSNPVTLSHLSSRPFPASRNLSPVIVIGTNDRLSREPTSRDQPPDYPISESSKLVIFKISRKATEESPLQTSRILSGRDQTGKPDPREDCHWLSGTKGGAEVTCMRLRRVATALGLPSSTVPSTSSGPR